MRLSTRVTFTVAGVTLGALGVSSVAALVLVRNNELGSLDNALAVAARNEAKLALARNPSRPELSEGVVDIPERLEHAREHAAIYDAQGRVLSATGLFRGNAPDPRTWDFPEPLPADGFAWSLNLGGSRLRAVALPVGSSGNLLLFAASREEVETDVAFLLRLYGALVLTTAGLAVVLARILGRRLGRDVRYLAGITREVADGNLLARATEVEQGSTETRALAVDLNHMISKLSALVAAQMTFVFHAAHELRSPLASLRAQLQLALRRERSEADYRELIGEALADAEELVTLAQDLLTLARAGSEEPSQQMNVVHEVVEEALRLTLGPATSRGVELRESYECAHARAATVRGGLSELSRALRNLLDNAIAHSPRGGSVSITGRLEPGWIRIAVADQGRGVDPEDRSSVFEPFFRGSRDQGGSEPGTGLGLTIARELARNAGGEVELDDDYGPGARFVLRLPALHPPDASEEGEVRSQLGAGRSTAYG